MPAVSRAARLARRASSTKLRSGFTWPQLPLVQRGSQHLERRGPVFPLTPLLLAGHYDPGGPMGEPHCRGRLVDMLPPRSRGPEHVHLDVLVPQVYLDGLIDVGIDKDRGEAGMPPRLGIV